MRGEFNEKTAGKAGDSHWQKEHMKDTRGTQEERTGNALQSILGNVQGNAERASEGNERERMHADFTKTQI